MAYTVDSIARNTVPGNAWSSSKTLAQNSETIRNILGSSSGSGTQSFLQNSYSGDSFTNFLNKFIEAEQSNTASANALQRQLMSDQISATRQENVLDRQFSAEQVRKQQEYNTSERLATQEYNSAEAQLTRDWQTSLDSTKYQRMVADLQSAGLNPMLALGNSAGSTPSGATAHSSAASSSVASAPGRSFSSASAFKSEYSKILGSVMDYLLRSEAMQLSESQFSRSLSFQKAKAVADIVSNFFAIGLKR